MRQLIYTAEFDAAVDALGGYRAVDRAMEAIIDGLYRNPYAFHKFENDFMSFRYALTKPIDEMPSLVVVFNINQDKDVLLEHIEENPGY